MVEMLGRRVVVRMAGWVLVTYGALVGWVGCIQRQLLYHPSPRDAGELAVTARDNGFVAWTNGVGDRVGWMRPGPDSPARVTVLIAHGNAGAAAERDYLVDPLQAGVSADVFLLEYPGFGGRAGRPDQKSFEAAMDEALALLAGRKPLVLVGESLGAAVAAYGAGRGGGKVDGLILLTPFNHLTAAARHHYPWLPVGWILRDRYPLDAWLEAYAGGVAVVVGGSDRVIPPALGRALYEGIAGRKRLWELPGQGHWEAAQRPQEWWGEAVEFVLDGEGRELKGVD